MPFEFKISCKQENADFLENKISAERAQEIFGRKWKRIIKHSTRSISSQFYDRPLIYKKRMGKTEKGSITLGWRYELLNKMGGSLSGPLCLSIDQVEDIYSGTNLKHDKKDSLVNGKIVKNSGVANFVFQGNSNCISSAQAIIDNLVPIREYAKQHKKIFFACKALNYRSLSQKYEGNRPLSVSVHWTLKGKKLKPKFCFDHPLLVGGDEVYEKLLSALSFLGKKDTDNLDKTNIDDSVTVFDE